MQQQEKEEGTASPTLPDNCWQIVFSHFTGKWNVLHPCGGAVGVVDGPSSGGSHHASS